MGGTGAGHRSLRVAVLAAVGSLALAGAASAKTYCVAPASGCPDGTQPDLQTALNQVQSDGTPGTIRLGASTYTAAGGFNSSGSTPVEIDGSGTGATTVTMTGAGPAAVLSFSGTPATIRSLRVAIPALSSGNDGIDVFAPVTISDVFVDGTAATGVNNGLLLQGGGSVSATTIQIPAEGNGSAAMTSGPDTTTISDSALDGNTGLNAAGPGRVVLHRDRVTGRSNSAQQGFAITAQRCSVVVDDSLIRAVSTGTYVATAITPTAFAGQSASVSGTELTILGDGGSWGIWSYASGTGASASANLSDVIIAEPMMHSIVLSQSGTGAVASVTTDHSDYDHSTVLPSGGSAFTPGPHDTPAYVDPRFADPGAGDYRLLPSSPLLNFDPTPLNATPFGPGESATDLAGLPRLTGTGRDVGAFQHQPPSAGAGASPTSAQTGVPVRFTGSGSDPDPGDPLSYSWHFDDGASASGQTVTHAFSTPGSHTAMLTVRDATGLTATAQVTVAITAPPPPQPRIGALALSPSRFAAARAGASVAARRHHASRRTGTTVTITVNVAAAGRFTVLAPAAGRRGRHHSCVGPTRSNRRAGRCTRWVAVGFFTRSLRSGRSRFHFTGRTGGHALAPGRYRLLVTARSGSRTSPPRTTRFTIIR